MTEDIITITEPAQEKIRAMLLDREDQDVAVRVGLQGQTPNLHTEFRFVPRSEQTEDDHVIPCQGFEAYVDIQYVTTLQGAVVDFDETHAPGGFTIQIPPRVMAPPGVERKEWTDPLALAVQEVLDAQVNPAIAGHGGYVVLQDVKDDTAYVELTGGCAGCAMSRMTLQHGIEVMIKEAVPQITEVVDSTDHTAGMNPYYSQAESGESALGSG